MSQLRCSFCSSLTSPTVPSDTARAFRRQVYRVAEPPVATAALGISVGAGPMAREPGSTYTTLRAALMHPLLLTLARAGPGARPQWKVYADWLNDRGKDFRDGVRRRWTRSPITNARSTYPGAPGNGE